MLSHARKHGDGQPMFMPEQTFLRAFVARRSKTIPKRSQTLKSAGAFAFEQLGIAPGIIQTVFVEESLIRAWTEAGTSSSKFVSRERFKQCSRSHRGHNCRIYRVGHRTLPQSLMRSSAHFLHGNAALSEATVRAMPSSCRCSG